jgi:hypothetical protein
LLSQVDERRQPRSKATLGMLIDRWLEVADVEESTLHGYRSKIETHIRPNLGDVRLSKWTRSCWRRSTRGSAGAGSSVVAGLAPAGTDPLGRRSRRDQGGAFNGD